MSCNESLSFTQYCPSYTARLTLPVLHCLSYTAPLTLPVLHCPSCTAPLTLPVLHCPSYTAPLKLPLLHCPSYTARLTTYKERERAEQSDAKTELFSIVRRQNIEKGSIESLQRLYRGHLHRKAAKRWALKKAELAATNALLHSAANFIQRCWRGYLGRLDTVSMRQNMAQFIALMRAQEAAEDEEVCVCVCVIMCDTTIKSYKCKFFLTPALR